MTKKVLQIFLFLFLLSQIILAQENDIVEIVQLGTYTNMVESYNNKPIEGIYTEGDDLFFYSCSQSKQFNFVVQIDIFEYSSHGGKQPIETLEGVFLDGKKSSLWRKGWSKTLREETYNDGMLDGISRVFARDGSMLYQTIFEKGTGYYKDYYYDNKQIFIQGEMQDGKRIGVWRTYYKDGTLKCYETYRNGLLDGKYIFYDEKGNILYSTTFSKGSGHFKSFDTKTGELKEEGDMKNGYRIGIWTKFVEQYSPAQNGIITKETKVEQSPDSPENRRLHHNLIEIVYNNGKAYYINASDLK